MTEVECQGSISLPYIIYICVCVYAHIHLRPNPLSLRIQTQNLLIKSVIALSAYVI